MVRQITGCLAVVACLAGLTGADWRQFRGNDTTSTTPSAALPTSWKEGENVAWKVDLPGKGLSGPIIVGDRVYLTASSGYRQDRLHVLSFDAATGKKLWERQFWATGRTMCHSKMSNATPTPASDGERIFAFYSSNDLVCLDLDGNLLWFRGLTHDYPNASNSLGMSSSPIVSGETLVVMVENDSESFTCGIDVKTGVERWKLDRPKLPTWTSPALLSGETPDKDLVLIQSGTGLSAIEPATGKIVWTYAEGCNTIPSVAVSGDKILVPSQGLTCLKHVPGSANPELVWQESSLGPATPSPLVYRDRVYSVNRSGVVNCADIKDGSSLWKLRLTGPFSGTPVAAGDYLYFLNEEGLAEVVKLGDDAGEIVSSNPMGEPILCTPAIANGGLYFRSDKHLWKVASKP